MSIYHSECNITIAVTNSTLRLPGTSAIQQENQELNPTIVRSVSRVCLRSLPNKDLVKVSEKYRTSDAPPRRHPHQSVQTPALQGMDLSFTERYPKSKMTKISVELFLVKQTTGELKTVFRSVPRFEETGHRSSHGGRISELNHHTKLYR